MRRVALVFVGALLVAGLAGAQGPGKPTDPEYDKKTHNGNSCHPRNGSEIADFRWMVRGLENLSSEYREVSCPVLRDDYQGLGHLTDLRLVVYHPGGGLDFCCTLYSFDRYGLDYVDSKECCFPTEDPQIWNGTFPMALDTVDSGYYGLYCDVPPGGRIHRYSVREAYPTDEDN